MLDFSSKGYNNYRDCTLYFLTLYMDLNTYVKKGNLNIDKDG